MRLIGWVAMLACALPKVVPGQVARSETMSAATGASSAALLTVEDPNTVLGGDADASRHPAANAFYVPDEGRLTQYMGSTYVPIDSWVYPVIERLAALNYVQSASLSVRPWTRMQCARLVEEAHQALDEDGADPAERAERVAALDNEFAPEMRLMRGGRNAGATAESAYSRFTGIGGTPLRDSFHFSQTIANDFGRPYGQGFNAVEGVSGRAEFGLFAFYARGEYQHSPTIAAYSPMVQAAIATSDRLPSGAGPFFPVVDRPRPVEAYVTVNLKDWQLSFGQQSLWFGPVRSTGLMMSNNAEAMPMLRLDRTGPLVLPSVLRWLGQVHFEVFLARTGGAHYVRIGRAFALEGSLSRSLNPQPFLWGATVAVDPTPNLEIGAGVTTVFAGYGRPLTFGTFFHTLSQRGNNQAVDPGDRRTEFYFSYKLPGLRNWLALYAEGLAEDESLPLTYPRRSAMAPGVYLPHLPGLPKVDLRAEAVYTNLPNLRPQGFYYTNTHYANGYSNYGQIIGSWVGPQGVGWQASSTYWMSERNTVSVSYRHHYTDPGFVQGGDNNDYSAKFMWMARPEVQVSGSIQYERWNFPVLAAGARSDVSSTVEIRFTPKLSLGH